MSADLMFFMSHPSNVIRDLASATRQACTLVDMLGASAPDPRWRVEPRSEPLPPDRLAELVIPNLTTVEDAGFWWGIVSGAPPRDLYLSMEIGVHGIESSGKARLRFEEADGFELLGRAFDAMSSDPTVDRLHLSVGVDFHLRQSELGADDNRSLPSVGWRNRLRRPSRSSPELDLPGWVSVVYDASHINLTLGPSPYDLAIGDVIDVRDKLIRAGYL